MTPEREREIRAWMKTPDISRAVAADLLAEVERLRTLLREAAEEIEHYSRERAALRAELRALAVEAELRGAL